MPIFRRFKLMALLIAAVPSTASTQVVPDIAVVPDIVVQTIGGHSVRLYDLFTAKLTIVEKWATWCAPCIADMPYLNAPGAPLVLLGSFPRSRIRRPLGQGPGESAKSR